MAYIDKCRCCYEGGRLRDMWVEYKRDGDREIYGEMLMKCFAMSLQRSNHKEHICELCVGRLRNAFNFKKQVLATEQLLLEQLEEEEVSSAKEIHKKQEIFREIVDIIEKDLEILESSDKIEKNNPLVSDHDTDVSNSDHEETDGSEYKPDDSEHDSVSTDNDCKEKVDETHKEVEYMNVEFLEDENIILVSEQDTRKKSPQKPLRSDKIQRNYTRNDSMNCLEKVMSKKISVLPASEKYNVPRMTIRDGIKSAVKGNLIIGNTTISKITIEPEKSEKHDDPVKKSETDNIEFVIEKAKVDSGKQDELKMINCKLKPTKIEKLIKKEKYIIVRERSERQKHQHNLSAILLCTNATPIQKRTDRGYMCGFCDNHYLKPSDLKRHTIKTHDDDTKAKYLKEKLLGCFVAKLDITDLQCNICNTNIDNLEELLRHLKTDHDEIVYTDIKNQLIPIKFSDSDTLSCFMCGWKFHHFKMLTQHTSQHYKNFGCEQCDKYFINGTGLANHNRREHSSGEHKCSHCPKVFDARVKKTLHERHVHKLGGIVITCGVCKMKFKYEAQKRKHLLSVHGVEPVPIRCHVCSKNYSDTNLLKKHIQYYHLKRKDFRCEKCFKEFYEKRNLDDHMLTHTKVKNYMCNVCGKKLALKKTLKLHMRIHRDDRRYKCDRCDKEFIQKISLRKHYINNHEEVLS